MKRESCEKGNLLDMEATFSDFNIPEALMHYGIILPIDIN